MGDGRSDAYRAQCEYEKHLQRLEEAYAKAMQNAEFVSLGDAEKAMLILIDRQKEILNDIHDKRKKILIALGVDDGWDMMDLKVAVANYERKKDTR